MTNGLVPVIALSRNESGLVQSLASNGCRVSEVVVIRILLIDSHDGVRRSLNTALATADDMVVVGEATNGVEAERLCARLMPDIVLMEIQMPNEDGIGILQRIRKHFPAIQVVVLTSAITTDFKRRALSEGVRGYLQKYVAVDELTEVIRAAHDGRAPHSKADSCR